MISSIITHPGGAHKDDFLACAVLLKNNFQRNWKYTKNQELDIDTFELIDESLGIYNTNMLEYCNIK